jgi:Cytochrome C oxidase, cbb3-type, subunit III
MRIFKSANCMGCHKWSGIGGGGYGGAAANLRATQLTPQQIEETVRCGRPGTGMPHFQADAYDDGRCYGLKKADLPSDKMPPEPDHPLRAEEIKVVAEYVVISIKGKGAPDLAQCQAFFGTRSRVCDIFEPDEEGGAAAGASPPHGHLKVEAAHDANAATSASGK